MRLPAVAVLRQRDDDGCRTAATACGARRPSNLVEVLAWPAITDRPTAGPAEASLVAQGVDPVLRRMVVQRAAEVFGARRDARSDVAKQRDDGSTLQEIPPDCALVCTAIDELSELGTLTCSTLDAMQVRFGDATIRTLALIVGWFASVSLILGDRPPPPRADGGSSL